MFTALQKAQRLEPEVRLAQAISEYEYILNKDDKLTFRKLRSGRQPEVSDVMALTAQIDWETSQRHRQCVGTRLTNLLETVQQFSPVIDTIVGGSQSMIASAIWGVVKTALLLTSSSKAYFDSLSKLFMQIGRKSPRYQDLALLYPSAGVRNALCEYFTAVVGVCKEAVLFLKKGLLAKLSVSFLKSFQSEFDHFQTDLGDLGEGIRHEITLASKREKKQELRAGRAFRTHMGKLSEDITARKRRKTKIAFLDDCATYDYGASWRQARKAGSSRWLYDRDEYKQWLQSSSGTLLCTGILGSGKTVVSANLVEELTITQPTTHTVVCYFFCRHNEPQSLNYRTILGALARQMLANAPLEVFDIVNDWHETNTLSNPETLTNFLKQLLSQNTMTRSYYLIIDGLDECDEMTCRFVASDLDILVKNHNAHLFCSCRPETGRHLLPFLRPPYRVSMEVDLDLERFVETELEEKLQSGALSLGDPRLVLRIRDALLRGSHGMFLWAVFQIEAICNESTDEGILFSLESLPKDLPETYNRILRRLSCNYSPTSKDLQKRIFQIMTVAQRPLSLDELREALSIVPGDLTWDENRLVNDMQKTLTQHCGTLALVNEEAETIEFAHPSVRQHLLGSARDHAIAQPEADLYLGGLCVTFLNFPVHEKQLVSMRGTARSSMRAKDIPAALILSHIPRHHAVSNMAIKLLKSGRDMADAGVAPSMLGAKASDVTNTTDLQYPFLKYAIEYWAWHSRSITPSSASFRLLCHLLHGKVSFVPRPWKEARGLDNEQEAFFWATGYGHEAATKLLLDRPTVNVNARPTWNSTALIGAAEGGHEAIVKLLLASSSELDVNAMDKNCRSSIWFAAYGGHGGVVDLLLDVGKAKPDAANHQGRTPLQIAASHGHTDIVKRLLETPGVEADARDIHGRTPLRRAAEGGHEKVVRILLQRDDVDVASRDEYGVTPLSRATYIGHTHVVEILEAKLRALGLPLETGLIKFGGPSDEEEPGFITACDTESRKRQATGI